MCKIFQKPVDDNFFNDINPLQWSWYALMVYQDKKQEIIQRRNEAEYLMSVFIGDDIKKLGESRKIHEQQEEFTDELELIKELGLEHHIDNESIDKYFKSGVMEGFDVETGGGVIGQDPAEVMKNIIENSAHKSKHKDIQDMFLNLDTDLDSGIDDIIVLRPDPNKKGPKVTG